MDRVRRSPRWLRVFAPLLLVVMSCHSIDENVFAHGPVPLEILPLREPVSFTGGASAGLQVPAVNGLLGTYFSGANYVYRNPGHNPPIDERLDHQQIDPNIDFVWDASDTNPVIAPPAGIDHNDGDPRLPDHWPIWSVVWEGYLEAPATGSYGLRLHVNNGGWLQMKSEFGGLATVIDCAGGTSFEGECDATRTLERGRHYIRASYYNNSPSVAAAIFSWQPPGSGTFEVVPNTRLFTQPEAAAIKRGFIFVHGIRGDFRTPGFPALLDRIRTRYRTADGEPAFASFRYHQDVGNVDGGTCSDRSLVDVLPYDDGVGYPVDFPVILEPSHCDSNDDIGVDGLFLDADIKFFKSKWGVDKITIISNSMGGAIVRAYLAYAAATKERRPAEQDSLRFVDGVIFLHGVQQGAYPLVVKDFFDDHPSLQPIRDELAKIARERIQIDPDRPAATDLAPQSALIDYVNRLESVPRSPHYANVRSDIRLKPVSLLMPWSFPLPTIGVGDYLLMPGDNNPTHTPPLGGAGILPSTVAAGASSGQWTLAREDTVIVNPPVFPVQIPFLISAPETHFQLGAKMDQICVRTLHGPARLDRALFDLIAALDIPRPDFSYLDFGDMPNVTCP